MPLRRGEPPICLWHLWGGCTCQVCPGPLKHATHPVSPWYLLSPQKDEPLS